MNLASNKRKNNIIRNIIVWLIVAIAHIIILTSFNFEAKHKEEIHLKFELVDVNAFTGGGKKSPEPEVAPPAPPAEVEKQVEPPKKKEIKQPKLKKKIIANKQPDSKFKVKSKPELKKEKPKVEPKQQEINISIATDNSYVSSSTLNQSKADIVGTGTGNKGNEKGSKGKGISQNARFIRQIKPPYPVQDRKIGNEGTVRLRASVSASGVITDIRVVKSSGSSSLDNAALDTYRIEKLRPALKDGDPVSSIVDFNVIFRLDDY